MTNKIAIIGSGTFACAIAYQLSLNEKNEILLFARDESQVHDINTNHTNTKYFNTFRFNNQVKASINYQELAAYPTIIIAIPSSALKDIEFLFTSVLSKDTFIINMAKGLSANGQSIVATLREEYGFVNVVTLKGPSFSIELMNNSPTILTLGYSQIEQSNALNKLFEKTDIYFDYSTDIKGVEYLSALKNIYAIFIGHIDGKFNSNNTRFFLLNQCFMEMKSILNHLGCRSSTADLSCGFGDFCLTALSDLSRNRTLGLMIGKKLFTSEILTKSPVVFEGIRTLKILKETLRTEVINTLPILKNLVAFFITQEAQNLSYDFNEFVNRKTATVITYGTFDLINYAQLDFLKRAKNLGDRLIVALSTDEFIAERNKTSKFTYDKRKEFLESLDYVDLVISESSMDQKVADIQNFKVDFLAMGDDCEGKFDELKAYCEVVYLPKAKGLQTLSRF